MQKNLTFLYHQTGLSEDPSHYPVHTNPVQSNRRSLEQKPAIFYYGGLLFDTQNAETVIAGKPELRQPLRKTPCLNGFIQFLNNDNEIRS